MLYIHESITQGAMLMTNAVNVFSKLLSEKYAQVTVLWYSMLI